MAAEGGQHMVEKPDAGGDYGFAGAIQVEAEFDIGFGGFAGNLGAAGHALAVAHSPRREKPWIKAMDAAGGSSLFCEGQA